MKSTIGIITTKWYEKAGQVRTFETDVFLMTCPKPGDTIEIKHTKPSGVSCRSVFNVVRVDKNGNARIRTRL
jgi:hypothetical protein